MKPTLNELGKTIHIIPLGHERERATVTFQNLKADLVYLVVDEGAMEKDVSKLTDMQKDQERFTACVVNDLKNKGLNVKIIHVNMFNLLSIINTLSKLILFEKKNGSNIFMNMSAAGRFASVATSISGMAHDVKLYYVHSERFSENKKERMEHGVSICSPESSRIEEFTNYKFEMPTPVDVSILELLYYKKNTNYEWATTKELSDKLTADHNFEEMPVFRGVDTSQLSAQERKNKQKIQSRVLMKLNGSIMKKLVGKRYVERNDPSENTVRYKLTPSGEYALHLTGFGPDLTIEEYTLPDWLVGDTKLAK